MTRRCHRNRPRTVLAFGLGVFAALNLGLSLVVASVWPDLRDPLYHGKEHWLRARTVGVVPKPFTVVFLGTSRTDRGVIAHPLEDHISKVLGRPAVVYNFGIDGAGALTRLIFLKRLLAAGVRPDLLIVEVLPPTWNSVNPYSELPQLKGRRLSLEEINLVTRYGGTAEALHESWALSWLAPWYEHRFLIQSRVSPALVQPNRFQATLKNVNAWGWQDYPRSELTPEARSIALKSTRELWAGRWLRLPFDIEGSQIDALKELLSTCRSEGIPTSLIWMPEGPTFRGWYPPGATEQIYQTLAELSRDFGVTVIDARAWIDDEEAFVDSHHLRPQGARQFSLRLGREVLRPWALAAAQRAGGNRP